MDKGLEALRGTARAEEKEALHTPGPWAAVSTPGPAECSPLPWAVYRTTDGVRWLGVGDKDAGGVTDARFGLWCGEEDGQQNAEFIVTAVNSHADLVEACKAAETWLESWAGAEPYLTTIRSAIAKATGQAPQGLQSPIAAEAKEVTP